MEWGLSSVLEVLRGGTCQIWFGVDRTGGHVMPGAVRCKGVCTGGTSHHIGHILLLRSKSQLLSTFEGRGYTKAAVDSRRRGLQGPPELCHCSGLVTLQGGGLLLEWFGLSSQPDCYGHKWSSSPSLEHGGLQPLSVSGLKASSCPVT